MEKTTARLNGTPIITCVWLTLKLENAGVQNSKTTFKKLNNHNNFLNSGQKIQVE